MNNTTEKFDLWCIVELFGHSKIAGRCTEQNVAGTNMLRVDVPETSVNPAFTRFFNHAAIYAINPVSEDVAIFMADKLNTKPIDSWDIRQFQEKALQQKVIGQPVDRDDDDEDIEEGIDYI
ncbi:MULTISPECIES: hypothetical protein [Olivibacter]|uniref:Acetyltransferase n=1 Tax=Olivibacter jilunii TaxID=985016 RepID=A0ABW6AY78_9SPHI